MTVMKRQIFTLLMIAVQPAYASMIEDTYYQLWHKTSLVYLNDQSPAGARAHNYYENFHASSYDGQSYNYLRQKYKPNHRDAQIGFATQLTDQLALTYIASIGSKSEKLEVQKSLKLGLTYVFGIKDHKATYATQVPGYSFFMVGMTHTFGGKTIEKSCTDDFNRSYNCRSALSVVDHPLLNEKPTNQTTALIKFNLVKDFF